MTPSETVIRIEHLRKVYGHTVAVEDISFDVGRGEIFGLLGSNGAGKTTTVECLEGIRRADGGSLRVLGLDPQRQASALRGRVGCQLQESRLPDHMKVWEALELFAGLAPRALDWRELLAGVGARGEALRLVREPLRRAAPAPLRRPRAGQRPGDRRPRRDDDRPRPGGASRRLGADRGDPRPRRHGRTRDPLHGRGRAALRPRRRGRTRSHRRARPSGRAHRRARARAARRLHGRRPRRRLARRARPRAGRDAGRRRGSPCTATGRCWPWSPRPSSSAASCPATCASSGRPSRTSSSGSPATTSRTEP